MQIHKEIEFYHGINHLISKYGEDTFLNYYWKPHSIKNGLPIIKSPSTPFEKDLVEIHHHLRYPRKQDEDTIKTFKLKINKLIKKLKFDFIPHMDTDIQKYALFRYHMVGALNNISLSVCPTIKKAWGITFELFGAFYNTHYPYCSLFSDLEPNATSDFFSFKLKKNMKLLVNPPYTEEWINITCEYVTHLLSLNMNTTIYLILPIWNTSDRLHLNLPILYNDLPILDELKLSPYLVSYSMDNLTFYNGINHKNVKLKDKVHIYQLSNKI
jgi:hypothetical protein